jgi:hypothetical protein
MGSSLHHIRRALFVCLTTSACGAYEPGLLSSAGLAENACGNGQVDAREICDIAIAAGQPDACPLRCEGGDPCMPQVLAGTGCQARCVVVPVTRASNGDGCCPDGVGPADDADCGSCGDSIVGPAERCDPPESCPTPASCSSSVACVATRYQGAAKECTAECNVTEISRCVDRDGCCPVDCDSSNDEDCSSECDGRLENRAAAVGCSDRDPCTLDVSIRDSVGCGAGCTHRTITGVTDGDGCCLPEMSARLDSDCAARCGNGVLEPGEPCDGGAWCTEGCQLRLPSSLIHLYTFDGQGALVTDAVGMQHGTAINAQLLGIGSLELQSGGVDQYVDLPNGIVASLVDATFEIWVTWHGGTDDLWQRIFDFGSSSQGENTQAGGASSLYLTPNFDGTRHPRLYFRNGAGELASIAGSSEVRLDARVHLAAVFSDSEDSMTLYLEGEPVASGPFTQSLAGLIDDNNWLGRGQSESPGFDGELHEFRIYAAALRAGEIRLSAGAGPLPPPAPPGQN